MTRGVKILRGYISLELFLKFEIQMFTKEAQG